MKSPRTQFGLRENTAPSRQHASLVAFNPLSSGHNGRSQFPHEHDPLSLSEIPTIKTLADFIAKNNNEATRAEEGVKHHFLTVKEVAELLRVPVSWVYERTRRRDGGQLPGYRLGKYWRFREDEVLAWINCQRGGTRDT
jgi:excisionase family DNA binding protein